VTTTPERFVVVGAGAIGGVLAAGLQASGADVVVVARGAHGAAIAADGLVVESPDGTEVVDLEVLPEPVVEAGDVVLLAVKAGDTAGVLARIDRPVPIVCVQNGVANEAAALAVTPDVYGVCVMVPATHLEPGVVRAHWAGPRGLLDVGRAPSGLDRRARRLASAFTAAGFDARAIPDVLRWKHFKLLMNLGNAVEALCGPSARGGPVAQRLEAEGRQVLAAAGIDVATAEEDAARRAPALASVRDDGRMGGGSTWQSLMRGASIESDWLNGEIVRIGRRVGVPTPANELVLQRILAATAPGELQEADLLTQV
jgi:2-dehydropantoate 2-reductase